MNAHRPTAAILAALCVLAGASAFASAPALASKGVVGYFGGTGTAGGLFSTPGGVAVNDTTGNVYAADSANNRVQEFSAGGAFVRAWGVGVVTAGAFEVCTVAASCLKGAASAAAGGMSTPEGVSVEQLTGDVYVTDQGNHRVDEFTEDGVFVRAFGWGVETGAAKLQVCTTTCKAGLSGAGAGEFGASIGYPAVDPVTGDVYVADPANRRVQVFEGDGVFKHAFGWGVSSGASEFQVCTSTCQAGVASSSEIDLGRFATGSPAGVALDASGEVYAVDGGTPDFRVQKFASVSKENAPLVEFFASAQLTGDSNATAPTDVAVEPTFGNVLVAREPASPEEHLVYELGSGGDLLETYAQGAALPAPNGLAVGPSGASVYLSTATGSRILVLGTIVPPTATVEAASGLTASEATLHGTVDPNEIPPNGLETTWQFEYSTNETEWTKAPAGRLAASTSPVAVSQTVTGLEGSTVYYVRLHSEKEFAAGSATSTIGQLTTAAAAPTVSGESVSDVAATSATFGAQINPQHLTTTYHFEYDTAPYTTGAAHGTSIPVPGEDIGEGLSDVAVSQHPQGLKPDTTYHYRVVAVNSVAAADGPDGTFTTQPVGGELELPDGRAWELVSPPDKHGGLITPISGEFGVIQAAEDGDAITYGAITPIVESPPANLLYNTRMLSTRGPGGWSSQDIETPNEVATKLSLGNLVEYDLFSSDLSLALVGPEGDAPPPLAPGASGPTLYLRDNADGSYQAVAKGGLAVFEGATPNLGHVVFTSKEAGLDPNYPAAAGLYEWAGGHVQLASVLPIGQPASGVGTSLGGALRKGARHAISNDGSRLVFKTELREHHLYMRDMAKGETVELDTVQHGSGEGPEDPSFQTANESESRVFFTDTQQLTPGSNAKEGNPDLYVCEIIEEAGKLGCKLTDLTADTNAGESADVQGLVPGASEDGSYVYFVADGILAAEATPGNCAGDNKSSAERERTCNLYEMHYNGGEWEPARFIATLSGGDAPDWALGGVSLQDLTSRVSPSGRYLAFMSDRELTGYDNHDVNSGEPDEEVFLYDAEAGAGPGRLVCASCNPTGARPAGVLDSGTLLVDEFGGQPVWQGRWLAGNVPSWTPSNQDTAFYQSRYLSDSGRLFFDSADALVPQDVNGKEDVYEYEPPGEGSCTSSSASFSARSEGCVGLISAGTSAEESAFLDASVSGDDVFFLTASTLVQQDVDTAMDVYDAHVCGAEGVACTAAAVSSPPCTTTDSCRTAPAPQPGIFGAPPSATFSGAGNLAPAPASIAKPKAKPPTRTQQLAAALKACRKERSKTRRAVCERKARKRYGAAKAKKAGSERKAGKRRAES